MKRIGLLVVLVSVAACASPPDGAVERVGSTQAALDAVSSFGANPGNLLMYRYAPASAPQNAPLVVVLHGCTQGAADIENTGFDTFADQLGFYVVYPQQQSANNPVECFNWFGGYNNPSDKTNITRGGGEDESIKEMVDAMKAAYSIDPSRVFVVGFSAGGGMAAVLLATYPDVFAAGGIDAGIPYGCPMTSNSDVFTCMNPGKPQAADAWATAVKQGDPGYAGPWPRVTIWQGTADTTVATANETELVKQWTAVQGLSQTPTVEETVDTYPHQVFKDSNGNALVDMWQITGMTHGVAVDPSKGCGTAGLYIYDEHECTALRMLEFFGIAAGGSTGSGGSGGTGGGAGASAGGGAGTGGAGAGGAGAGGAGAGSSCGGAGASADQADGSGSRGCGAAAAGAPGSGAGELALGIALGLVVAGRARARKPERARARERVQG